MTKERLNMQNVMYYGKDYKSLPVSSIKSKKGVEIASDLYQYTTQIVNIVFYGEPSSQSFVLIDTGMPGKSKEIIREAEARFGSHAKPKAIILTHGHFDHVGSIIELIKYWDVPVYAHPEELPYLTGAKDYPAPDATVDGGLISKMSKIFPNKAINLDGYIKALPEDFSVPYMPDFKWVHTPGHISLYRAEDSLLVAGDAITTVKQDNLKDVLTQKQAIYGPPRYFTTNWAQVKDSIRKLLALKPEIITTGHGRPLKNHEAQRKLDELNNHLDEIILPKHGKYVNQND